MSILRLAIASPLRTEFDYLPPEGVTPRHLASLQPGCRVRVPFGAREVTGYLLSVVSQTDLPADKLRRALEILDDVPLPGPVLMRLCRWAASYYHHPLGEVISAGLPAAIRHGKAHRPLGMPAWRLSTRGKGLPAGALGRSPKQGLALQMLQREAEVTAARLKQAGVSAAIMRTLRKKNLIEPCTVAAEQVQASSVAGLALNDEQAAAVAAVGSSLGSFHCHLLEGITGSGKTEVYLQLIDLCLERGLQVLVLVPEIGLTPQTLGRFQARFEANIVSLHSGLAEGERYNAWEAARSGAAHAVIGTRSAVFAPLRRAGLIIVDEEHDGSYKQRDGFRYSARDIAVKRGQLEQCPVLLGSATPSLESIYNAASGRYQHHRLRERAGGAQLPGIEALDIRKQALHAGFCTALLERIGSTLERGRQVLLFLNRRGYAPTLLCHDCGWLAQCHHCDARLTVHLRAHRLRCHHCGAAHALPRLCPECRGEGLMTAGLGTEQADDFLRQRFPDYTLHRVDSDSMRGKNAMQSLVEELAAGEPCILLGTQMLTKGHHFPGVTLVAVIDADAALFSTDFRGEERMAQLLTQVAGRAGRAGEPGEVLLQTHYPDHPALQSILTLPYAVHARSILEHRLAGGLPPGAYMAMIRTDAISAGAGEQFLHQLRGAAHPGLPAGAKLIGPLPSPMQRRAGRFRSQLLLTAPDRGTAQAAATHLVALAQTLPARKLNWTIDIDPQDSL